MNKSHCNLGALVSLWLKEYHQSFFFDQTGRSQPEAALFSDYNAFRISFKGGGELRVAGCELRVTGCGLRVAGCELRGAGYGLRVAGCGLRVTRYGFRVAGKKSIAHSVRHRSIECKGGSKGLRISGENGIGLRALGMAKNSEIGMRKSEKGLWIVDLEKGSPMLQVGTSSKIDEKMETLNPER